MILKLAEILPEGMVTLAGTLARVELLLDRFTSNPPAGAVALSVTVPIDVAPPMTVVGLSVNEVKLADVGAVSVIAVEVVTPL